MNDNKQIAVNTIAIYFKLIVTTIIGLFTSRYVLLALGQSDFGLYSVVGSIIAFINIIGVAMYTTTRRYINIEMGKGNSGNPNKIFNISLIIHVGFAVLFLIVAESIGLWYINNYLNVAPGKLPDAHFVFQVSTIVACLNLINVPYQGLLNAFQKFWQVAFIEITIALIKITFVIFIASGAENALRVYAVGMSAFSLLSFFFYHLACRVQWRDVVKFRLYNDIKLYKEILVFNNYTALGAVSCLGRNQGATMVVNYFFGTMVNGAFAVAHQIQSFTQMFAGNISHAAAPQITQAYSGNQHDRAYYLCSEVTRITILIMICIVAPLFVCIDQLLVIWLKNVPEGASILCKWVLIVALIASFSGSLTTYIHAVGKVKWFQILGSMIELSLLPISFIFFKLGYPPVTLLIILSIISIACQLVSLILLKKIDSFDSINFVLNTYTRVFLVICVLSFSVAIISIFVPNRMIIRFVYAVIVFFLSALLCFFVGLKKNERKKMASFLRKRISKKIVTYFAQQKPK